MEAQMTIKDALDKKEEFLSFPSPLDGFDVDSEHKFMVSSKAKMLSEIELTSGAYAGKKILFVEGTIEGQTEPTFLSYPIDKLNTLKPKMPLRFKVVERNERKYPSWIK